MKQEIQGHLILKRILKTSPLGSTIRCYQIFLQGSPTVISQLTYESHTPLCVRVTAAYGTIMLFIGWTSCEVQVMALEDGTVRELCKLSSHEDWVRSIDVRELDGKLLLAIRGYPGGHLTDEVQKLMELMS